MINIAENLKDCPYGIIKSKKNHNELHKDYI